MKLANFQRPLKAAEMKHLTEMQYMTGKWKQDYTNGNGDMVGLHWLDAHLSDPETLFQFTAYSASNFLE